MIFQLFLLLLYNDCRHPWAAELSADPDLQIRFPQDGAVRDKRQIQTGFNRKVPDLSDIQQGCEIQGYETREREICEEIVERICLVGKLNHLIPPNTLSNTPPNTPLKHLVTPFKKELAERLNLAKLLYLHC